MAAPAPVGILGLTLRSPAARVWTDYRLWLYTLLQLVAAPIVIGTKLRRHLSGRTRTDFDLRRWFLPSPLLLRKAEEEGVGGGGPGDPWQHHAIFVAASVGEFVLAHMVAKGLLARRHDLRVSFCIRDPSTIALVQEKHPELTLVVWPFDFLVPVGRWLDMHRPDAVILTERFRYTVLSTASARYGAKVAVINGRSKMRDTPLYRLTAPYYRWTIGAFHTMCMQRQEHVDSLESYARGVRLLATGDLKVDLQRPALGAERARDLELWLGCGPLLAAGSTETAEEERMVLEAFRIVRCAVPEEDPRPRLLLAPRQVQRADAVAELIDSLGFTLSRRTAPSAEPADVLLLDTIGELAHAYGRCEAAYVGGAYLGFGHNVLEPVEWGVPVSYGMRRGHFETMQRMCEEAGVATRIRGSEDLAAHWLAVLQDPTAKEQVRSRSAKMLEENRGVCNRTVQALDAMITSAHR